MNPYTKEEFFNVVNKYRELESRIGEIAESIAVMRNISISHFDRWEYEYTGHDPKKPDLEDYCRDIDGEMWHYERGTTYTNDLVAYENEVTKAEADTNIEAICYLGWESEYTTITFPARYLWSTDWREQEQTVIDELKAQEEAIHLARQAKREAQERAEYERLAAKFGKKESTNV